MLLVDNGMVSSEYHLLPTKRYIQPRADGTFVESDDLDAHCLNGHKGKLRGWRSCDESLG